MTNTPYGGYSQYPNAPYPGAVSPQAGVKPATPGSVWIAWLIYLLAAVAAVVGIVLVVTSNVWNQAINDAAAQNSNVNVQSLINSAKVITVAIGVIFAALFLFFDFMMRAGRNWSRIVLTVLSALSILSAFGASASSRVTVNGHVYSASSSTGIGWAQGALSVLAIILMYLPASNAYFRASLAFRKGTYR